MEYNIEFKGLNKFGDEMLKRAQNLALRKVVMYHTANMQRGALRRVPVLTGFLKGSIELMIEGTESDVSGKVKATAEYAGHVEYGTFKRRAKPYIGPSYQEARKEFIKDINRIIETGKRLAR